MTHADLPLIKRWLETPHVAEWWHDPSDQFELVSGDLDHPNVAQFIVRTNERPFAYLQCYRLSDWNNGFGPQPDGTRGIDQFIGEARHARPGPRLGFYPRLRRQASRGWNAARGARPRT